jgi:hypothetical protein
MLFDDEREAFRAYAEAMPGNCVLLVDTYGTLDGVKHAIETARWLRTRGAELESSRQRAQDEMAMLHTGVTRFVNPHQHPVGLEKGLFDLRTRLILEARRVPPAAL